MENFKVKLKKEMNAAVKDLKRFIKSQYLFETLFFASQIIIMISYVISIIYYSDIFNNNPMARDSFEFIFKVNRIKNISMIVTMLTIATGRIKLRTIFRTILILGFIVGFIDYIF